MKDKEQFIANFVDKFFRIEHNQVDTHEVKDKKQAKLYNDTLNEIMNGDTQYE